jgi:hypothetical protein
MSHASQLSGIAASPLVVATAVGTCATWRVVNAKAAFNPEADIVEPATNRVKPTM